MIRVFACMAFLLLAWPVSAGMPNDQVQTTDLRDRMDDLARRGAQGQKEIDHRLDSIEVDVARIYGALIFVGALLPILAGLFVFFVTHFRDSL
jgi:hypothetical protein